MKFIILIISVLLLVGCDIRDREFENLTYTVRSVEIYNNESNKIIFEYTVHVYMDNRIWRVDKFYSVINLELSVGDTITLSELTN